MTDPAEPEHDEQPDNGPGPEEVQQPASLAHPMRARDVEALIAKEIG